LLSCGRLTEKLFVWAENKGNELNCWARANLLSRLRKKQSCNFLYVQIIYHKTFVRVNNKATHCEDIFFFSVATYGHIIDPELWQFAEEGRQCPEPGRRVVQEEGSPYWAASK
jgi:hypothetical protein